jgi:Ycf66 protein N-terminus
MIHMELAPSTLLGLCLTIAGILLYLVRIKKKTLSRDYDLFFSSVGCLCGGILIFQGWRLDPILLLCQMMSGGTAIFFIAETIWLRNIDVEKEQINFDIYQNMLDKSNIFF